MKNGVNQSRRKSFGKRQASGRQLIEDHASRVKLGSRVHEFAAQLLGSHVGKSSHHARASSEALGYIQVGLHRSRQPEIQDFQPAIQSLEEISGLQIAMNYAFRMGGAKTWQQLQTKPND